MSVIEDRRGSPRSMQTQSDFEDDEVENSASSASRRRNNDDDESRFRLRMRKAFKVVFYSAGVYVSYKLYKYYHSRRRRGRRKILDDQIVSLSKFLISARRGEIEKAMIGASYCLFQAALNHSRNGYFEAGSEKDWMRVNYLPGRNSESSISEVLAALTDGGCENVTGLSEPMHSQLAGPAMVAAPFVYLALLYRMLKGLQKDSDAMLTSSNPNSQRIVNRSRTTFADVAGIEGAKAELKEIVMFLKEPQTYSNIGARAPRGVLLYGPSGTGKTLLARAVAGEASVPFLACSASDFVEMLVGRGAARIRDLFDKARKQARENFRGTNQDRKFWFWYRSKPNNDYVIPSAVIFIDEIDALAKSRGGINGNDEREQTLNQLLTEMDGFESRCTEGSSDAVTIVVIAATNRPEVLDKALLRPGRFDRHVYVGYPDAYGRKAVLRVHARNVKLHRSVNLDEIAESHTNKFSGAELSNVINEAALLGVRDMSKEVQQRHLIEACQRISRMKAINLL